MWTIRAAQPPSRSASGFSAREARLRWESLVTVVYPWTLVNVTVQLEPSRGRAPWKKFAQSVFDRLNMSTRQLGYGAADRMYDPFRAQEARRHLIRRSGRTQARQTQILRRQRHDQGTTRSRRLVLRP